MISLGLSYSQQVAFEKLLRSHHTIFQRIQVLDMDHRYLSDLSRRLIDGQVSMDTTADISRTLTLDLSDPLKTISLDGNSPSELALFVNRMIRVHYVVINPAGTASYAVPVFTGPVTKLERVDAVLKLEAQGKETLGLSPAWAEKTWKKGVKNTAIIRSILVDIMGENRLDIPNLDTRSPRTISVGGDKLPWKVAKAIARSMGYLLFYDGRGVAVMRKYGTRAVYTFKEGQDVKTLPEVGFSIEGLSNAVEVRGRKPKKGSKDKQPIFRATAPRSHPLSPWALGRSGAPRFIPTVIQDDSVRTNAAAKSRALSELNRLLVQSVDVSYDTLPIPHLEESDVVGFYCKAFSAVHRVNASALPLSAAGDMSMGYVKNVTVRRAKTRKRSRVGRGRGRGGRG